MKKSISLLFLCISCFSVAQEKWTTQSGTINFEASVPLFEEVSAQNNSVKCVVNTEEKTITCVVKIKDFTFKRDLMKTHFNEIYMESDRYPRAVFKGTISNLDTNKISPEGIVLPINGKIKIHGVTQNITVKAMLTKVANGLQLITDFDLNTDDFKIEIPSMILPKISKTVHTHLNCTLQ